MNFWICLQELTVRISNEVNEKWLAVLLGWLLKIDIDLEDTLNVWFFI